MTGRQLRHAAAASATPGVLVDRPGRLYGARLVAEDPAGAAAEVGCSLYDSATGATGRRVLTLAAGGASGPDDWPPVPLSLSFEHGLFPAFTAGDAVVYVFWETD